MRDYFFDAHIADTIIDSNVSVEGDLQCEGAVCIDGQLIGDVSSPGSVTVDINSEMIGDITADAVIVRGKITGDVKSTSEIIIDETGMIIGDVWSSSLTVMPGGVFAGSSHIYNINEKAANVLLRS